MMGTVMLWLMIRKSSTAGVESRQVVIELLKSTMFLMQLCLIGIIVFGAVRAAAYSKYEWNEAAGKGQVTLLIVKHVILTFIFAFGLVLYLRARKLTRQSTNE